MKKYIKPEIAVVELSEDIMFCASPNFDYDNPGKENAYENGCAKENNHSFSIWGDE